MIKIAPSILACNFANLENEVRKMSEANIDFIHFDIMDGRFVPNITFGPKFVSDLRNLTNIKFDIHLMVEEPLKYYEKFIKAGADLISFHIEAEKYPLRMLSEIKKLNKVKSGIAFNPATAINYEIIADFDFVLIMSVEPGFAGQKFIASTINKIKSLRKEINKKKLKLEIEVDGGININNFKEVVKTGANIIVMGAGFFENADYKGFVKKIKSFSL